MKKRSRWQRLIVLAAVCLTVPMLVLSARSAFSEGDILAMKICGYAAIALYAVNAVLAIINAANKSN